MLTRRNMLKGLLGGAALAATPAGLLLRDPEEPVVRRYWAVGAHIRSTGLEPIEGQPGLFRDRSTGQVINIRDFKETDKYDTIVVKCPDEPRLFTQNEMSPRRQENTGLTFRPPQSWKQPEQDETQILLVRSFIHGTLKRMV